MVTVDANVVSYYWILKTGNQLPEGLRAQRLRDFSARVLDEYPIAMNDFIRTEYEGVLGVAVVKNWLTHRLKAGLLCPVQYARFSGNVRRRLRDDYGFDCNSRDSRYLESCNQTAFKVLVTANTRHFHRPHRQRDRRGMPSYLERELGIRIRTIDDCCVLLLDDVRPVSDNDGS
ncbi:hypothetical protein ACFL09_05505 [Planctomycetota bacterium]